MRTVAAKSPVAPTCRYCPQLIDPYPDAYTALVDHMIDFHRALLIAERPVLRRPERP